LRTGGDGAKKARPEAQQRHTRCTASNLVANDSLGRRISRVQKHIY
jgi:hypothetical protein